VPEVAGVDFSSLVETQTFFLAPIQGQAFATKEIWVKSCERIIPLYPWHITAHLHFEYIRQLFNFSDLQSLTSKLTQTIPAPKRTKIYRVPVTPPKNSGALQRRVQFFILSFRVPETKSYFFPSLQLKLGRRLETC
jgi:hypothetical protein